jgi:predicted nucleotidyltransferase
MYETIIARLAFVLTKHAIPYMIIGGQAVLLYGNPRLTKDVDVTLDLNVDSLNKAISVINEIGLKVIPENYEEFVRDTMVLPVRDEKTSIRVDLIFSFTPYEKEAIQRAQKVRLGGVDVTFAAPEDVIIHKIFAGRPRDLEDVSSILAKQPNVDREYIRKWLREFDSSSESSGNFLKTFNKLCKSIR